MTGGTKDDGGAPPPRETYMPKPPSKEEVDQVSREQGMIADDWTGEPSASEAEDPARGTGSPGDAPPRDEGGGG